MGNAKVGGVEKERVRPAKVWTGFYKITSCVLKKYEINSSLL